MSSFVRLCLLLIMVLVSAVSVSFGQETGKVSPRVLILGNSITRHGPKADIDWHTNWGMAASALEKDFAHILIKYFTQANDGKVPEHIIDNILRFRTWIYDHGHSQGHGALCGFQADPYHPVYW